jgi:glycosyltransferase involved in cell wall biosynthesis
MKVVHGVGYYFPDHCGGTEVYVSELARGLASLGVESVVAAARDGYETESYPYHGTEVFRYPVGPVRTKGMFRSEAAHTGFDEFKEWLVRQRADVYHQHSWTLGCNIHHLRAAKALGMPAIVTVHVPGQVCLRGTMLLKGTKACDGKIERIRCGACWGMSRGQSPVVAEFLARIPKRVGMMADKFLPDYRASTALQTPRLVDAQRLNLLDMADEAGRVVALCQWLYDALLANGVDQRKLALCRSGVAVLPRVSREPSNGHDRLRVGYLGRLDRLKGVHVLIEAVRQTPANLSLELSVRGVAYGDEGARYCNEIKQLAGDDRRITIGGPLAREEVPAFLAGLDLLALPSQSLENAPMTLLEAHAVGTPVLGSDLGGIDELIRDGVNGWLVPYASVSAWTENLARMARNPSAAREIRQKIDPPRTMDDVALEMKDLYLSVIGSRSRRGALNLGEKIATVSAA